MHIHIHTYTHTYIHTYIHTYMDDAWMHTYIPGPRPNESPIKMQRVAQTEIADDEQTAAMGDDADDGGDNDEEGDEEEDNEDDPTVEPGELQEGS